MRQITHGAGENRWSCHRNPGFPENAIPAGILNKHEMEDDDYEWESQKRENLPESDPALRRILALMVIPGEENCLDQSLDPDFQMPVCFQGLLVLDRARGITSSMELVTDLDESDFDLTAYYTVDPGHSQQEEYPRKDICFLSLAGWQALHVAYHFLCLY